jgi:hypothetical protein
VSWTGLARADRAAAEVAWGTGTQIDFYDRPAQMMFAIDAGDALLRRSPAVSR